MQFKSLNKTLINLINVLKAITLFAILFITVTLISSVSYSLATVIFKPYRHLDPDNCFLLLTIHHIIQGIIAIFVILLLSKLLKLKMSDFGFNKKNFKYAVRKTLIFCGIWIVVQFAGSLYIAETGSVNFSYSYPLTAKNFISNFLFEVLLTGTSEEILFRALTIPITVCVFKTFIKSERLTDILAIAMTTMIFALAHINFNLNPFMITHFNPLQQITCLILGSFFGYLFVKTKSVLGPMLAHNALNGVIAIVSLVMYTLYE